MLSVGSGSAELGSGNVVGRKWECYQQEVRMLSAGGENAVSRRGECCQQEGRMLSAGGENAVSRGGECCQQEGRMLSAVGENAVSRKWERCQQEGRMRQKESETMMSAGSVNALIKNWAMSARVSKQQKVRMLSGRKREWCQHEVWMLSAKFESAASRKLAVSTQQELRMLSAGNDNSVGMMWKFCHQEWRRKSEGSLRSSWCIEERKLWKLWLTSAEGRWGRGDLSNVVPHSLV